MDIGRAFQFIWEDERKVPKLATGVGVFLGSFILSFILVGLVGFCIIAGYTVRLLQNVRDGDPTPLPEWDQWGDDLTRGFKYIVVGIVWAIPAIILSIVQIAASAGAGALEGEGAGGLLAAVGIGMSCLSFVYNIFIAIVTPGFSLAFAEDEQISSGIAFNNVISWTRQNIGQVILAALFMIVAGIAIMIAGAVGSLVTCGIGAIVVMPLAGLVYSLVRTHLYGQLGNLYPYGSGPSGGSGMSHFDFDSPLASSPADTPPVAPSPAPPEPPEPPEPPATTDF